MTIGRRLHALGQVLGVLLVTAVLIALIELGAGFLVRPSPPTAPRTAPTKDTVTLTLTWLKTNPAPLVPDVDLLWRNEPGARKTQLVNPQPLGRNDSWTIENNSAGLRGPEITATKDAGVFRILCVGDSVTFGYNVDQPDAYPRQLQALLERRYPTHRFEVLNSGVPGWSWLQGLRFLETRGLAMQPDVVVIGHGTNDQFFPAKVTDEERFRRLAGATTRIAQTLRMRLARTNSYRLVERFFPPPPFSPDEDSPGCKRQIQETGACHRVSLDEIAAAAHEVNRVVSTHDRALLLVNLDFLETQAVNGLRRALDRGALSFLDVVDHTRGLRRRDEDARAMRLGLAPASKPVEAPRPTGRPQSNRLVLRVLAADRTGDYSVRGTGNFQPSFKFSEPAYDDGTHGDQYSGDGVYSATVAVPATIGIVQYLFYRHDDAELRALPPSVSAVGDRVLAVPGDTLGPIDVFGNKMFLAERAHPNRDGHRVVATLIADSLETVPSFRRFAGLPFAPEGRSPDS